MSSRADYDYRALGRRLRPRLEADGRGWRRIAIEIGVTPADLSRISCGQATAAHKVMAVCDWLGIPERTFYRRGAGRVFHGERTETASPASRADAPSALPSGGASEWSDGGQSAASPSAKEAHDAAS